MGASANKRELRRAIGPEFAAALEALRTQVVGVGGAQRLLAGEMHQMERDVAAIREGRTHDARRQGARLDELKEQLEALQLSYDMRLVGSATEGAVPLRAAIHVLVDAIKRQHDRRVDLDNRVFEIEKWIYARQRLTRRQRLWSFITGRCAAPFDVDAHLRPAGQVKRGGAVTYEAKGGAPLQRVSQ